VHWRTKAGIQRVCARVPFGRSAYFLMQTTLGNLRNYDYAGRFVQQRDLAMRLLRHGAPIEGAHVFEVGTGWMPLIPIGYWMAGTARVSTYDLNRHLSFHLLRKTLCWMDEHGDFFRNLWQGILTERRVATCLGMVRALKNAPKRFLQEAGIAYAAPADASCTGLPEASVDLHTSVSVLEHIPRPALAAIFAEAKRIVRPGGAILHLVDPTDHFAHGDPSIPHVHFLRFDEKEWRKYNDNPFAFHNRLFDSDYRRLFETSGFQLKEGTYLLDERSLDALKAGFPLAPEFRNRKPKELCRRHLCYLGFPERASPHVAGE